eukprot:g4183.t1
MCGWRKLAYNYSTKLRPDSAALVHDALSIPKYCGSSSTSSSSSSSSSPPVRPADASSPFPPLHELPDETTTTIYVDGTHGKDTNLGTKSSPLKTIQAAVDHHAAGAAAKATIIIRAGTYYLSSPVTLSTKSSGLTLTRLPGETVWLSGGVPLESGLQWKHEGGRVWSAGLESYALADVATLRVDGQRVNPARYPNADPEREFWPVGYTTSKAGYVSGPKSGEGSGEGNEGGGGGGGGGDWLRPTIEPVPNPAKTVNVTGRPWDAYFTNYTGGIGGTCAIYDPPFSFWCSSPPFSQGCGGCFTWQIPAGLETRGFLKARPGWPYKQPEAMQVMAWRAAHWANWAFEVKGVDAENGTIHFGKGGFQGARGGPGSDWFVQNIREELDAPNEFFYDQDTKRLYLYSNETDASAPPAPTRKIVAVPAAHHTLLTTTTTTTTTSSTPTQAQPLRDVTIAGLGFRDTAWTMLQPHGGLTVRGCVFDRLGGNALMLSKYNQNASVTTNSFSWLGGSAVALWGWTDEISDGGIHGVDGTTGDFPRYTRITRNLFREVGVWEKQSSAVFQAKSAQTTIDGNVVFNLARAGINLNDGFGGGDVITNNVLFNTCRESSDHGPINSWDRQPFITTVRDGTPSALMAWRRVEANLVVANYGGSKEVDNDDGSLYWRVTRNVMVYGWGQKFKCGGIESFGNLKAYIELGGKFDAGCLLQASTSAPTYAPNLWHDDTMIVLQKKGDFAYRQCWGKDGRQDYDKTRVYNNTIYVPNQNVAVQISSGNCPGKKKSYDLEEFQKMGEEPGSARVVGLPSTSKLCNNAMVAKLLRLIVRYALVLAAVIALAGSLLAISGILLVAYPLLPRRHYARLAAFCQDQALTAFLFLLERNQTRLRVYLSGDALPADESALAVSNHVASKGEWAPIYSVLARTGGGSGGR